MLMDTDIGMLMDMKGNKREGRKMREKNIEIEGKRVLVTGVAGFIGSNVAKRLLSDYDDLMVIGIDNMNDYYDVKLKEERLSWFEGDERFKFIRCSIADKGSIEKIFNDYIPDVVVNLAAQAGVRYSISHPQDYIDSNIIGFFNILECCRHSYDEGKIGVQHLVYASSSSVYGRECEVPYSTEANVDKPVSLYAATKKSDELMAYAYSKLYEIPSTGLRFFTVYGPCGRPDMAYFSFTEKLKRGEKIKIFNYGNCRRDFTYIDDIVEGIVRVLQSAPERELAKDGLPVAPYRLYNIGKGAPESLLDFVTILQEELVRAEVLPKDYDFESHKELVPMQAGDVEETFADTKDLERDFEYRPTTELREGLRKFAEWNNGKMTGVKST